MGTPLGPKYIPYTYMDPLGMYLGGKGRLDQAMTRTLSVVRVCGLGCVLGGCAPNMPRKR